MSKSFRVSLADGTHYDAQADENLLAAAQRAHWLVRYGCRNGNCEACTATLLQGRVQHRDGRIIETSATPILMCLCHALSDVQIALPSDPRPGSMDQSQRSYARLHQQRRISERESILHFTLPAGRAPTLRANQIALIETDAGLLQADIDHENSRGRELILKVSFISPIHEGAYYHVRYPLNATHTQENRDG